MKNILKGLQFLSFFLWAIESYGTSDSKGYIYEVHKKGLHIFHVVTIDPKQYTATLLKAKKTPSSGRETVSAMAERSKAEIAINGGFFEIGDHRDGNPSGVLIINGKAYGLKKGLHPLALIESGHLSLQVRTPRKLVKRKHISAVSGIPMLVEKGEIPRGIKDKKGSFYTKPHGRTAIGIRPDGTIVIVVVEHSCQKNLSSMSLGEIRSLLKEKQETISTKYHKTPENMTLHELELFLEEEYSSKKEFMGMTILEVAELMKQLRCQTALNLCGGRTSTLWIGGKVMNYEGREKDRNYKMDTEIAVADAIIFKRN